MKLGLTRLGMTLILPVLLIAGCGGGSSSSSSKSSSSSGATASSSSSSSQGTVSSSQNLVIAMDMTPIKNFDPDRMFEIPAYLPTGNIYDTLVTYTNGNYAKIQPSLATTWSVGQGGTVYTFKLRQGVKFSNGDPFTASDVVFSLMRLKNLNDNPAYLAAGVKEVTAVDPSTVKITLTQPDDSFLAALTATNFGILDAKAVKAQGGTDGANAAKADTATTWLNTHSVGTGPFMLKSYTPDQRIVLVKNPNYWGTPAKVSQVTIVSMKEANSQNFAVQKGSVDVALNLTNNQLAGLANNKSVKVVAGPTFDLVYLGMTMDPKKSAPLAKPLVDQAIRDGIDYQGIITGILKGGGLRPATILPEGLVGSSKAFNDQIAPTLNIQTAKNLLKQAGYPNGFTVDLTYSPSRTFEGVPYNVLAPKIKSDLAKIGVTVNLKPLESSALLSAFRAGNVQMVLWNWGADYLDSNDFSTAFGPGGSLGKRLGWTSDPALEKLDTEADATTDNATRISDYHQIANIQLKSGPWASLVQPVRRFAEHTGVSGISANPIYLLDLHQAQKQ